MRALASDFDGTLYFKDLENHYKEQDIQAIQEFQKKGNWFGLCTGRDLASTLYPLHKAIKPDFYIVCSGAAIFDANQTILFEKTVSKEVTKKLYEQYASMAAMYIRCTRHVYAMQNYSDSFFPSIISTDIPNENIESVSFGCHSDKEAKWITEQINMELGNMITAYQNTYVVDICAKGCSKGNALQSLKDCKQIDIIAGIGDFDNDIPLLDHADISFTFHSSPKNVRQHATYVIQDIAEAVSILQKEKE